MYYHGNLGSTSLVVLVICAWLVVRVGALFFIVFFVLVMVIFIVNHRGWCIIVIGHIVFM